MRERLQPVPSGVGSSRITPARAGKTQRRRPAARCPWDHPRSYGKDKWFANGKIQVTGSPPLVRERPSIRRDTSRDKGITPACAGKTLDVGAIGQQHRDHPRSCGKDSGCRTVFLSVHGITPARAGKTSHRSRAIRRNEDHPRSCGKDSFIAHQLLNPLGSPPLVRERPGKSTRPRCRPGITPARAGKTCTLMALHDEFGDHPRSYGKDL